MEEKGEDTSYRISRWTAEFVDPGIERAFRHRSAPSLSRQAQVAVALSALFFLCFAVTDFIALGLTPVFQGLLAMRVAVSAIGVAVIVTLRLRPQSAANGIAVTVFEVSAFIGLAWVIENRSESMAVYGMSMVAMLAAVYIFLPNRFVYMVAVGVAASLFFGWLVLPLAQTPVTVLSEVLFLLALINTFGVVAARRLSCTRRDEYRSLAQAEQTNARLSDEIARRRRLEKELMRLASTDPLTELSNRRGYLESSHKELRRAARTGRPVAVLLVDIDWFKQVNDRFGHAVGDEALRRVARILRRELRNTDMIARFGGEEFAITLPETDLEKASAAAERVRSAVERECVPGMDTDHPLTVTVGVAVQVGGRDSLDNLLARADKGLYRGKRTGRNRVVVHGPVEVAGGRGG